MIIPKRTLVIGSALMLLSALDNPVSNALAQGSLIPPGPPGPTMKTLDQVEARTAVTNSAAVTISEPGSYYLTHGITVASGDVITIATNGVTLDLNGFRLSSTVASATGSGIQINNGLRDITILNGLIQGNATNNGNGVYGGGGLGFGIYYSGVGAPVNILVSGVAVSRCLYQGITLGLGSGSTAERCRVDSVGGPGIYASTIRNCSAINCGGSAIYGALVADSTGSSSANGYGIYALYTVQNSYGSSFGTSAGLYSVGTAQNCYGYSPSHEGVYAYTALNCNGSSDTAYGVRAKVAQNCYGYGSTGTGVYGEDSASGCYGQSDGNGYGVLTVSAENCRGLSAGSGAAVAATSAINCRGVSSASGAGVAATAAMNCVGNSSSGDGISAGGSGVAIGCWGASSTGIGVHAYTASSCYGTTVNIVNKYNMP